MGSGDWCKALAVVDLPRAAEFIEREFAAPPKPDSEWVRYTMMEALEVLTLPPRDRLQRLARRHGFWFPSEEGEIE